jgi:hypothetical protein
MHHLVIGGAGVLRPAALELLRAGHRVTVTARTQASIAALADAAGSHRGRLRGIAGDYEQAAALEPALIDAVDAAGPFELALVYMAAGAPVARAALAAHPAATVVDLLTSAHGAPGVDASARARYALRGRERSVRLLLGWARDAGASRWHTPAEISAAALAARGAATDCELVLGVLRPWRDRPA